MRKRYFISAGIMAALLGLVLAVLAALPPFPGVTKANLERIEVGMTLDEVENIMGRQADSTPYRVPDEFHGAGFIPHWWQNEDGSIATINFRDDIVIHKGPWVESAETFPQKIRRWLHWKE